MLQSLRKTGPYHGYGLWLQCSRSNGLPDHRLAQRTAHRHSYQQLRPLQRPSSGPRNSDHAFFILTGVAATFFVSRLLSATVLKGVPSSFTLELPPYRRPQIGRVIWRSILDRTLFILGRAAAVAAPAGLVIWILANVSIGDISLLARFSGYLDPIGRLMGMDGVILMAFILGLPANEIVIPIIIMAYTSQGTLIEPGNLSDLHTLLISQGWTWVTALCTMVFFLFHWPCSTTLMTIKKETGCLKWTCLAVLLPTACGVILCMAITAFSRLLTFL